MFSNARKKSKVNNRRINKSRNKQSIALKKCILLPALLSVAFAQESNILETHNSSRENLSNDDASYIVKMNELENMGRSSKSRRSSKDRKRSNKSRMKSLPNNENISRERRTQKKAKCKKTNPKNSAKPSSLDSSDELDCDYEVDAALPVQPPSGVGVTANIMISGPGASTITKSTALSKSQLVPKKGGLVTTNIEQKITTTTVVKQVDVQINVSLGSSIHNHNHNQNSVQEPECTSLTPPPGMTKLVYTEVSFVFGGNEFILSEEDIPIFENALQDHFRNLNNNSSYFQDCVKVLEQFPLYSEDFEKESTRGGRSLRNLLGVASNGEVITRSGTGVTVQTSVYVDPTCVGCPDPQTIQLDDINLRPEFDHTERNLQVSSTTTSTTTTNTNSPAAGAGQCKQLIPCLRRKLPQYFNTVDDVMATGEPMPLENIVLCYLNWSIVMQDRSTFLNCEEFLFQRCGEITEQCYCLDPCVVEN